MAIQPSQMPLLQRKRPYRSRASTGWKPPRQDGEDGISVAQRTRGSTPVPVICHSHGGDMVEVPNGRKRRPAADVETGQRPKPVFGVSWLAIDVEDPQTRRAANEWRPKSGSVTPKEGRYFRSNS